MHRRQVVLRLVKAAEDEEGAEPIWPQLRQLDEASRAKKQGAPQAWKEMGIEPVERPGLTRREEVDGD